MRTARFYGQKTKGGNLLILLKTSYKIDDGTTKRLSMTTGVRIPATLWSKKDQAIKPSGKIEHEEARQRLRDIERALRDIWTRYRDEGRLALLTPERFKDEFTRHELGADRKPAGNALIAYMQGFLQDPAKRSRYSPITLNTYENTLRRLLEFFESEGREIDFADWDKRALERFARYLRAQGLKRGTVKKYIFNGLKPIFQDALANRAHANIWILGVKPQALGLTDAAATQISLTRDELRTLHALHLEGIDQAIRDLFLAACFTGMRYDDWAMMRPENIVQLPNGRAALHYFTSKGASEGKGQEVVCPLHPAALEAIHRHAEHKYNPSNPVVNLRVKEIARMAGITSPEKVKAEIKGEITTTTKERAALVMAHTARRTANTEMKRFGLDDDTVAALIGHARRKTMTRHYDKRDLLEIAVSACESGFFNDLD